MCVFALLCVPYTPCSTHTHTQAAYQIFPIGLYILRIVYQISSIETMTCWHLLQNIKRIWEQNDVHPAACNNTNCNVCLSNIDGILMFWEFAIGQNVYNNVMQVRWIRMFVVRHCCYERNLRLEKIIGTIGERTGERVRGILKYANCND